jgi:hypothetical protein
MPTIKDAVMGVKAALTRVEKLGVGFDTGQVNPPYALLRAPSVTNYRAALAGQRLELEMEVVLLTSGAIDEIGTLRLLPYSSPSGANSIPLAIQNDRKLGGVVEECRVNDFRPLGMDEAGVIGYQGGVFTLAIMMRGEL